MLHNCIWPRTFLKLLGQSARRRISNATAAMEDLSGDPIAPVDTDENPIARNAAVDEEGSRRYEVRYWTISPLEEQMNIYIANQDLNRDVVRAFINKSIKAIDQWNTPRATTVGSARVVDVDQDPVLESALQSVPLRLRNQSVDVIYLLRLAQKYFDLRGTNSYMKYFDNSQLSNDTGIVTKLLNILIDKIPTMNLRMLSVAASCLADCEVDDHAVSGIVKVLHTACSLKRENLRPKYISRFCKGLVAVLESNPSLITLDDFSNFFDKLILPSIPHLKKVEDFSPTDAVPFYGLCCLNPTVVRSHTEFHNSVIKYIVKHASVFSASEASQMLVWAASAPPVFETHDIVSGLKLAVLRTLKEDLSHKSCLTTITALGRLGAWTKDCRKLFYRLIYETHPGMLTETQRSLIFKTAFSSPVGEGVEGFDAKYYKKVLVPLAIPGEENPEVAIRILCGLQVASPDNVKTKPLLDLANDAKTKLLSFVEESKIPMANEPNEFWSQFSDLYYLDLKKSVRESSEIENNLVEYLKVEKQVMLTDPVVQEMMKIANVEDLTFMDPETAPFPVLIVNENKKVIDIDSHLMPCTRTLRAKIASDLGLSYTAIDSLSWSRCQSDEEKVALFNSALESSHAFVCNTPTQRGEDSAIPEPVKSPYFAYVRRLDLK